MKPTRDSVVQCEGWWHQDHYGRQPMSDLQLVFAEGTIEGSGTDIVGPFTFSGTIDGPGNVVLTKHYIGGHRVRYHGSYDGEGTMQGQRLIDGIRDSWMIRICHAVAEDAEIISITPD